MHGGVKFYRGAARAARAYVERDRSRADDYYLAEGSGVATLLTASSEGPVTNAGAMNSDTYELWVAGRDIATGANKGRVRDDANALRFVEVVVNGPKTWSLAAALHPEVSAALDAAQDKAAAEIVGWVAKHATTRVGPRGRQVQVPVEDVEAAVIRHYTSRAGDPHRHLHIQINARVWAEGAWRGIHSVGVRDSIEAINGLGHAAVAADPNFRVELSRHGFTLDPETSEIVQLKRFVGAFSARAAQIRRNSDASEAAWRAEHPGEEPGPKLRESWDRQAWAKARPDKVVPKDGRELVERWNNELRDLGYAEPGQAGGLTSVRVIDINRDVCADLAISVLGAKKSAWNAADIRGITEVLLTETGLIAGTAARSELAEDITARAIDRCIQLLARSDVPEHVRTLTSPRVLDVETDLIHRLARRGTHPARPSDAGRRIMMQVDPGRASVVGILTGESSLVVVEGAAGAGKTHLLKHTHGILARYRHRMMVVTPTLKAAQVAAAETGADGHSAAWLIHQHGYRWDTGGHWTRDPNYSPRPSAQLRPGDLLVVDEAGMLDQDTAHALLTIADKAGARVALIGDRHQLPAVGRGGVLDHAVAWAHPTALLSLEAVHRFADPAYAALSLRMRNGEDPGSVFDELVERGEIVIHPSEVERTDALAELGASGDLVIADTREQVADLNAAIHDHRGGAGDRAGNALTTSRGEQIGLGDRVATRHNDPTLQVANRQTWTVAGIGEDGNLLLHGHGRDQEIPAEYADQFVELAFATTIHGAQGDTVRSAHAAIGDKTGAAAAYVAMTRGRDHSTAHLVAESVEDARIQWIDVFSRDRADLGPAHARSQALDAIDRYGPQKRPQSPYPADRRHTLIGESRVTRPIGF